MRGRSHHVMVHHSAARRASRVTPLLSMVVLSTNLILSCVKLQVGYANDASRSIRPVKKRGGTAAGVPRSMGEAQSAVANGLNRDQVSGKCLLLNGFRDHDRHFQRWKG